MNTCLIVVDVQNDFLPGGALGVSDGFDVIEPIIELGKHAEHVVLTADWHPSNHFSFSDEPKFEDGSWPAHCVEGTPGAQIHERILEVFPNAPLFQKGTLPGREAYSGFDGFNKDGDKLLNWLTDNEVESLWIAGLALDYCVKATAIDAIYNGFEWETCLAIDATRPVSYVTGALAVADLAHEGVIVGTTEHLTKVLR